MTGTQRARAVCDRLEQVYPDAVCALHYQKPYELMIAARLSAQCTDARVNIVTKDLFVKYPSVEAFAEADLKELEQDIRPTGFYHNKAKNIIACCQRLMALHGGEVPSGLEEPDFYNFILLRRKPGRFHIYAHIFFHFFFLLSFF